MKCFILDGYLRKRYLEIPKTREIKEICLYLKGRYGLGGYYLENIKKNELKGINFKEITISIDRNEIRYFSSLCW